MTSVPPTQTELIHQGQGLVYSLASKIHRGLPMTVDLDDLVAYGEIGLAEAARDFKSDRGVRFTTFAYYRVRGAIYDGLSKMCWTSRARYRRLKFQQMANEALENDAAQNGESSQGMSRDATWLSDVTEKIASVYLISQQGPDGEGIRDSRFEDDIQPAVTIAAQRELSQKLRQVVAELPHNEARLIKTIYFEGATLQEAANRLGISKSWASRLHAKILEQMGRTLRKYGASD